MSLFRMTEEEYDRLNPPAKLGEVINDDQWLYLGHMPKPKTSLGWFIYNVIHGLAMRYRVLPVLAFSFSELFREDMDEVITVTLPSENELNCHYDDVLDTLYIHLNGNQSGVVDWVDGKVALMKKDDTGEIIGFMVEGYEEGKKKNL